MKQYQVRMTVQAEENILEYAEYIMTELLNPQAAVKFVYVTGVVYGKRNQEEQLTAMDIE